MKKYHFLLTMLLLAVFANNANAQVCNDNEDGVYKIRNTNNITTFLVKYCLN